MSDRSILRPRSAPATRAGAEDAWITVSLTVGAAFHGYRLDRFLSERIPRLSRQRVRAIIAAGNVSRRGAPEVVVRPSTRVRRGDVVVVERPAPDEPDVVLDFTVLHRDAGLLVIDKPAGLPVHPSARYHRNTLTALMRERFGADHGWEMAHRLDRETSGVLVLGHTSGTTGRLKRAFQERLVCKRYLALVHGEMRGPARVEIALGPAAGSKIRIKMGPRPHAEGGRPAVTEVEPVSYGMFRDRPITLVAARPLTGRQHQIRVHLDAIGHPVVGDKLYGIDEEHFLDVTERGRPMADLGAQLGLWRHALHAERIELPDPTTGARTTWTAPWPAELAEILPLPTDKAISPTDS